MKNNSLSYDPLLQVYMNHRAALLVRLPARPVANICQYAQELKKFYPKLTIAKLFGWIDEMKPLWHIQMDDNRPYISSAEVALINKHYYECRAYGKTMAL